MNKCYPDLLYFFSSTDWPQHIPQLIAQSIRNFFQSDMKYTLDLLGRNAVFVLIY